MATPKGPDKSQVGDGSKPPTPPPFQRLSAPGKRLPPMAAAPPSFHTQKVKAVRTPGTPTVPAAPPPVARQPSPADKAAPAAPKSVVEPPQKTESVNVARPVEPPAVAARPSSPEAARAVAPTARQTGAAEVKQPGPQAQKQATASAAKVARSSEPVAAPPRSASAKADPTGSTFAPEKKPATNGNGHRVVSPIVERGNGHKAIPIEETPAPERHAKSLPTLRSATAVREEPEPEFVGARSRAPMGPEFISPAAPRAQKKPRLPRYPILGRTRQVFWISCAVVCFIGAVLAAGLWVHSLGVVDRGLYGTPNGIYYWADSSGGALYFHAERDPNPIARSDAVLRLDMGDPWRKVAPPPKISGAATGGVTSAQVPLPGTTTPIHYVTVSYWLIVGALLIPALWGVWSFRRLRRRCRQFRCAQCGHDLRSSPFRCPECGLPGPWTPEP